MTSRWTLEKRALPSLPHKTAWKTTTLDAFFLAMYGKRGFRARYQGVAFEAWLNQAYAIDAVDEDRAMSFALDMVCPVHGDVRIERTYWLLDAEDGGLSEEFELTINGRPLEVEEGERRSDVASRWVEALLPLPRCAASWSTTNGLQNWNLGAWTRTCDLAWMTCLGLARSAACKAPKRASKAK